MAFNGGKSRTVLPSHMLMFARNFFRYPAMLGSLVPSSRFLVNDLLGQIDWRRAGVIVEYGPGVGTITQHILKRMRSNAVLVAIELNQEFAEFLRHEVADPRLRVVHASACDVGQVLQQTNLGPADYIISGIPYTTMPENLRRKVLEESRKALKPEGAFLVYQFTRTVLPYLESNFGTVHQDFQPLNILPARIFHCTP
jgi:phospholipid N-methyltransferase